MLHPHFGLSWFKKLGSERASYAKTLFEHVFASYARQRAAASGTAAVSAAGRKSTGSSFFDAICKIGVESDDEEPVEVEKPEYERFYKACRHRDPGDINTVLLWWKVQTLSPSRPTSRC